MKPETVKRWHSRALRAWWRWKSKAGRKPVALEIQQLIRRLSETFASFLRRPSICYHGTGE